MEVRAKKALGQHFLVDLPVARRIVDALAAPGSPTLCPDNASHAQSVISSEVEKSGTGGRGNTVDVLEIGPGMGVLTRYLLQRPELNLKMVELDSESVQYLMTHFEGMAGRVYQADYLRLDIHKVFPGSYCVIGNFPYNISSQIFFKILDDRERVPEVVCMVQKEVAERIAEGPGSKTYGILSVLLQAWYDIEYLFTVEPGAFAPPPKVRSAVIRLRRNSRAALVPRSGTAPQSGELPLVPAENFGRASTSGTPRTEAEQNPAVPEAFFRKVVKTAFGQRRKTLRNTLRPLLPEDFDLSDPILQKRAEQLSVEEFISLSSRLLR